MPKLMKIQNPKFIEDVENVINIRDEFIYSEKTYRKY